MPNFLQLCPQDIFNGGQQKDGAIPQSAGYLSSIVANNQSIIPAISGKKIAVTWLMARTGNNVANGSFVLKSASGGAPLSTFITAPLDNAVVPAMLFPAQFGILYFTTNISEGLFVDVNTQPINFTVGYIAYTP